MIQLSCGEVLVSCRERDARGWGMCAEHGERPHGVVRGVEGETEGRQVSLEAFAVTSFIYFRRSSFAVLCVHLCVARFRFVTSKKGTFSAPTDAHPRIPTPAPPPPPPPPAAHTHRPREKEHNAGASGWGSATPCPAHCAPLLEQKTRENTASCLARCAQ